MKTILLTALLSIIQVSLFAQIHNADPSNVTGSTTADYNSLIGSQFDISKINSFGSVSDVSSLKFGERNTEGDSYLFENWDNNGAIYVGDKVYRLSNINYHIKRDQFITRIQADSMFIYDKYGVDSISVNNRKFKKFYDPTSKLEKVVFAEVVYDANGIQILKNYYVKEVEGSPNPMINRPTNVIKKRSRYYTTDNSTLVPYYLNRRNVLKQINDSELEDLAKDFAKENNLSFKSDEEVPLILDHVFNSDTE